jgi:hypothetical protein
MFQTLLRVRERPMTLFGCTNRCEGWKLPLHQVQAASKDRGYARVADQWSQLAGEVLTQAEERRGNHLRVGIRASLSGQHSPEHVLPCLVSHHRPTQQDRILTANSFDWKRVFS